MYHLNILSFKFNQYRFSFNRVSSLHTTGRIICQNIFQESPNHGWFYCSHIMKPPRTFVKELLQQLRNLPLLTFRPRPPKPPGCCWMSNWKSSSSMGQFQVVVFRVVFFSFPQDPCLFTYIWLFLRVNVVGIYCKYTIHESYGIVSTSTIFVELCRCQLLLLTLSSCIHFFFIDIFSSTVQMFSIQLLPVLCMVMFQVLPREIYLGKLS